MASPLYPERDRQPQYLSGGPPDVLSAGVARNDSIATSSEHGATLHMEPASPMAGVTQPAGGKILASRKSFALMSFTVIEAGFWAL